MSSDSKKRSADGFDTVAVHAGEHGDPGGALDTPLVLSNAFGFESAEHAVREFERGREGAVYGRWSNPTVAAFERKMAALEGCDASLATASGMAAIAGTLSALLKAGDHVLAPLGLYAETAKVLRERFARFGVTVTFVDMTDLDAVDAVWTDQTQVVWCETPANPVLAIYDIRALSTRCTERNARLVVDSTFATPFHQQPLALGADLVVHSATKAIGGHGDVIGGVVCGSSELVERIHDDAVRASGGAMSPFSAWLLTRGVRTLGLRMARCSHSAMTLAERLHEDARVESVSYPGLATHPQHALAARQMQRGFGSMIAFEHRGGLDGGRRTYDRLSRITRAVSLGDVRSLVTHPASTTHRSMQAEQRARAGITDGLFRLSVGIEDVEDLWADLDAAL